MIKSKFILNNYTDGQFIKTGRKAGNASYFYRDGKQYLVTRETDYIYGKKPDGTMEMYLENDGSNIALSQEALYDITDNNTFIKHLTHTIPRNK